MAPCKSVQDSTGKISASSHCGQEPVLTHKWFVASMSPHVYVEVSFLRKALSAMGQAAFILPFRLLVRRFYSVSKC